MRLTVCVPATSANLGPGFDCFGLALDLCNEVTVDTDAERSITWEGEGAEELPTDGSDMVSRAMAHTSARMDDRTEEPLPRVGLHGVNRIPFERGLGSSSAAVVAGAALARALRGAGTDGAERVRIFEDARDLEGHPDNAAPAVFGGFTVAEGDGAVHRFDVHPDVRPAVLVPARRLSTATARAALSPSVARIDAVFNVAHAGLVALALTEDPDLLSVALRDRLHEDVRLAMAPEVREMIDRLRGARIPSCVSGAGPSLLAFERPDRQVPDLGEGWRVLRPGVRGRGLEIGGG
jgi:homoserine kinase